MPFTRRLQEGFWVLRGNGDGDDGVSYCRVLVTGHFFFSIFFRPKSKNNNNNNNKLT